MKLIDKDKVVEEIERIKKEECPTDSYEGRCKMLWFEQFSSFLDTLETKEVEDAFIEKACEWMSSHLPMQYGRIIIYNGFGSFIKDFRKEKKKKK